MDTVKPETLELKTGNHFKRSHEVSSLKTLRLETRLSLIRHIQLTFNRCKKILSNPKHWSKFYMTWKHG